MARPESTGILYFSFDVDFFEDEKIEAISGEFGLKGELITIKLLCAIYRNGYFIQWSEMLKMKLLKNLPSVSAELLDNVIKRLVKWEFFNEDLFNSEKILTSSGIQKRYSEAVKRRKNSLCKQYWLLDVVNVDINPSSKVVSTHISTQSKVKESKVNNIIDVFDDFKNQISSNEHALYRETFYRNYKLKIGSLSKIMDLFNNHLILKSIKYEDLTKYKEHFLNWVNIQDSSGKLGDFKNKRTKTL